MALINKIRERSGIAVVVIAVALLLFIVGGDIFSGNSKYFGGDKNKVGEIAGTSIDYPQFQQNVETLRQNYQAQSGKTPTEQETQQIREQAWQQMINDYAYKPEFDKLGIKVTPDELREAVALRNRRAPQVELEASGGVSLGTVGAIAAMGVERISVGALTHSAPALDLAFDWK